MHQTQSFYTPIINLRAVGRQWLHGSKEGRGPRQYISPRVTVQASVIYRIRHFKSRNWRIDDENIASELLRAIISMRWRITLFENKEAETGSVSWRMAIAWKQQRLWFLPELINAQRYKKHDKILAKQRKDACHTETGHKQEASFDTNWFHRSPRQTGKIWLESFKWNRSFLPSVC